MSKEVVLEIEEQIAVIRVARPEVRNGLNWQAQEEIGRILDAILEDRSIRALIITGTGERAFVSGGDLVELKHHFDKESGRRLNQQMGAKELYCKISILEMKCLKDLENQKKQVMTILQLTSCYVMKK